MSHTTTIKNLNITDVAALRSTIEELKASGVKIDLLEQATPRMYYSRQEAEVGVCDFVIKLPNSRYDIGLVKDNASGGYATVFDDFAGEVRRSVGAVKSCQYTGAKELASIGRLMQTYAKHAAINAATADGYTVTESYVDDHGNVQLHVEV